MLATSRKETSKSQKMSCLKRMEKVQRRNFFKRGSAK